MKKTENFSTHPTHFSLVAISVIISSEEKRAAALAVP